jgi:hypothetical protein
MYLDYYPFSLFSRQATPFVTTLHGRLDLPEHQPVFDTFNSVRWCRSPIRSAGHCRGRTGRARCITACPSGWCQSRSSRAISHSSAASRRKTA